MSGSRTRARKDQIPPAAASAGTIPICSIEMDGEHLIERHVPAARLRDGIPVLGSYTDDVGAQLLQLLLGDACRDCRMPLLLPVGGGGECRQLAERQLPLLFQQGFCRTLGKSGVRGRTSQVGSLHAAASSSASTSAGCKP